MKRIFSEELWSDYLYWQRFDKKITKRINEFIRDIKREPFFGTGKPEPLKHNFSGFWSCRITEKHRLIHQVAEESLLIAACRYHY